MSTHLASQSQENTPEECMIKLVGFIIKQALWDYVEMKNHVDKHRDKFLKVKEKRKTEKLRGNDKWVWLTCGEEERIYEDAENFIFSGRMDEMVGERIGDYIRRRLKDGVVDVSILEDNSHEEDLTDRELEINERFHEYSYGFNPSIGRTPLKIKYGRGYIKDYGKRGELDEKLVSSDY